MSPCRRSTPQELLVKLSAPFRQLRASFIGRRGFKQVPHAPPLGQESEVV
jgi:hypothetical protein